VCLARGTSLFPSFVAALKATPGTDEESKKIGVLVQVCCAMNSFHDVLFIACNMTSQVALSWCMYTVADLTVCLQQLEEVNKYLRDNNVPYLGGESPNQADLGLAPKLYHVETAMKHYKVCCSVLPLTP